MYPDLNEDNNKDDSAQFNYQATTTTTTTEEQKKKKKGEEKETEKCCFLAAKLWISIIGILNLVLGLFLVSISLYAKFAYVGYADLSEMLPTGGIWMIFGFGLVLAFCSIMLICSACFYQNPCFKTILVVFAIILVILLVLEVASAAVVVWGLGVVALPKSQVTDAAADRLLDARAAAVNSTWTECCIVNTPPYNVGNISKVVDSACLWPKASDAVQQACGTKNVFECVCASSTAYGSFFGIMLQSRLLWVGIVTIIFAILLLVGIISTCVLIFAKRKKKDAMYREQQTIHD